jgi:hypothetical protein
MLWRAVIRYFTFEVSEIEEAKNAVPIKCKLCFGFFGLKHKKQTAFKMSFGTSISDGLAVP